MKCRGGAFRTSGKAYLPGRTLVPALSAEEPETAADFVLADDGRGVAVADAVFVGEPVGAFVAAEEGGPGFQVDEPLRQFAPGHARDARDEALVGSGGVRQRHWHLRVGSRFQSRLPHRRAPDKTQFATFPQCPVCQLVMIFTSRGYGPSRACGCYPRG